MEITRSTREDISSSGPPRRILVAVHGHEPTGWETRVRLALTSWPLASVRVLGTIDAPSPTFTSVIPAARRARVAALRAWRRLEEERVGRRVDALLDALPAATGASLVRSTGADPGRAIARHAEAWDADLVVVGPDRRPWLERCLLGAIHERVVARARCEVLIIPAPRAATSAGIGRAPVPAGPPALGERRPLAAGGEA